MSRSSKKMFSGDALNLSGKPLFGKIDSGLLQLIMAICVLALIWAWDFCGLSFVSHVGMTTQEGSLYRLGSNIAQTIVCAISIGLLPSGRIGKVLLPAGALSAALCVLILCFHSVDGFIGDNYPLLAGFCLGLSYGFMLVQWISKNINGNFSLLLIVGSAASVVMACLTMVLSQVQGEFFLWLCLLMPACILVFPFQKFGLFDLTGRKTAVETRPKSLLFIFLSSLLSGGIARSLISGSLPPSKPLGWFWAIVILGLACIALLLYFRKKANPSSILTCFIGCTCVIVLGILVLPFSQEVVSFLLFDCAWYLLIYSILVSVYCGSLSTRNPLRTAYLCLTPVFATDVVMGLVNPYLSQNDSVLLTGIVVFLALSLVCLLLFRNTTNDGEQSVITSNDMNDRTATLVATHGLSERESEVFALAAKGYSIKGIGEKLFISQSTVKFHQRNIYQKLGVETKQQLIDLVNDAPTPIEP